MATISDPTLDITNVDDTTVLVTVSYGLVPNQTEKLARTVFQEDIELRADDSGTQTPVFTFANGPKPAQYAVDSSTGTVLRSREHKIPKSTLNEDPGFLANGAQDPDEILAQITISYAANAPTTSALPPVTTTSTEKGAWV
ncbi:MAG: hypothetical protein ACJ746_12705 [Bryobacteraceae bacterium]